MVLGDFNARVGVLKPAEEQWQGVLGRHDLDERSAAGEDFMQFCASVHLCAMNQLSVMNTWFQKKTIHFGTWMHPATKQVHMIDSVVMKASQRAYCKDVQVG